VAGTCDCGNEPSGSIKCGECTSNHLISVAEFCCAVYNVQSFISPCIKICVSSIYFQMGGGGIVVQQPHKLWSAPEASCN
jgi:hypothetical protein